jgi:opacity protein-like surface antigen
MIKPYVGFGGGVTIVRWEAYYTRWGREPRIFYDVKIDDGTDVKLTFGIPFGCEFQITPNFSLGPRAE